MSSKGRDDVFEFVRNGEIAKNVSFRHFLHPEDIMCKVVSSFFLY